MDPNRIIQALRGTIDPKYAAGGRDGAQPVVLASVKCALEQGKPVPREPHVARRPMNCGSRLSAMWEPTPPTEEKTTTPCETAVMTSKVFPIVTERSFITFIRVTIICSLAFVPLLIYRCIIKDKGSKGKHQTPNPTFITFTMRYSCYWDDPELVS
ncbi:unnamed protein product [Ranitomeya imitator]|uniref:Uncharacterized protein n=1 Tax=Ranitomeya imitator TaxID=111125 RepID=A0ABN9M8E2_9NEOB|nr:unnamed protein product [Ranitomeya imitator]